MAKRKSDTAKTPHEYEPIAAGAIFRAIAVHNPHAIRIVMGEKTVETRKWDTDYRGPLMVCSTARPAIYPNGFALGIGELVECRRMVESDEPLAWVKLYDAFSWVLARVRPITPFKVKGGQRFFRVVVPAGTGYLPRFAASYQYEMFGKNS